MELPQIEPLEKILYTLANLGWKPRGKTIPPKDITVIGRQIWTCPVLVDHQYSINDLCSIESGFRQFVCSKNLYQDDRDLASHASKDIRFRTGEVGHGDREYRAMCSQLREDKIEFIIKNVLTINDYKWTSDKH